MINELSTTIWDAPLFFFVIFLHSSHKCIFENKFQKSIPTKAFDEPTFFLILRYEG